MSYPNDSQYANGDFMNIWQPHDADEMEFSYHDFADESLPASFSNQMFAEASSVMSPKPSEVLTTADPFGLDAAIPHEHDLDIDLSLDWRVPDPYSNQFLNTTIPGNTTMSSQNINQSFVPFDQRSPVYNFPSPYAGQYFEPDLPNGPLFAYPSPLLNDGTESQPCGRQTLQHSGPLLHSTAHVACNNDSEFSQNTQLASSHDTRAKSADPKRENRSSLGSNKVSLNRAAKQRGDPSCDPALCYSSNAGRTAPWGSLTWNGQHLFSYTPKGQWLRDRCFTTQQFREYADHCGKYTTFWVQQTPTQCNHRLEAEDRICRWANCPVANRTIAAGWLRVAFDEFPHLTSNGTRDPLKCAGSVHLWCFEQIFDPMEFHLSGRLRPEDRRFPFEDKSVVTLEKLTDVGIIREAYRPWFEQRRLSFNRHPQKYSDSLSYRLTKYHIENQTAARQKARSKRNNTKSEGERRTIDVHLGNLKKFVEITNRVKKSKKIKKLQRIKTEDANDLSNSSSQQWALTGTQPATNRTQRTMEIWQPEPNSLLSAYHQSEWNPLADRNQQESSGPIMGPVYQGYMQPNVADSPSVSSQNKDSIMYQFDPTLNSNISSRQSTIRPSVTTASTFPNYLLKSHLGVSNQNYSQNATEARFNRAIQERSRPVPRPIITQHSQQYPFPANPSTRRSPIHEEQSLDFFMHPGISGDELEVKDHHKETVSEASDAFMTHTLMDSFASQPPRNIGCAVSPRVTATSPYWDSLMDFGGFGGVGLSPLLKGFITTDGGDGDRAATLTGVSVQHVSSPKEARLKRKNLSSNKATQSGQGNSRRRTDASY
ncbi:hypothetical protein V8C35DRAFT_321644 [Trichoderma chlorosporum]